MTPERDQKPVSAKLARLRRLNLAATLFFGIQVVLLLILSDPVTLPVFGSFLTAAPGSDQFGTKDLFDLRVDLLVALFLALALIDHLFVATLGRRNYESNVVRGINPVRWIEYSISASIMVVLIAMLSGASDVVALLMMFGANAAMILFGLVMERTNLGREEVDWSPFVYGCLIGAVPWIGIAIQFMLSESDGSVPGFVYGIFVSLFILFNGFAVNMWLGYRGKGRWNDPLFVELVYVILSLTAKTALAWQVYSGALAGSSA
ncbi:MAG: heliorhodopsin HeR [Thermoleophilia bacterium]|nr:heliorhodopsin HeR [Thermoleophilia bacterium]